MPDVPLRLFPIDSGMNLNVNPFRLSPGETPDSLNVDFDRGSAKASGGAIKLGNKVAPRPGVLCRPNVDGRLPVLYSKSAPVVGHVTIPWKHEQDIGGDFSSANHSTETDRRTAVIFPARRGKAFAIKQSFRLPETEKLFSAPTNPGNADNYDAGSDLRTHAGADLAIDECTIIAQKGGDGMTPMSWALGVVNTGGLLDVDIGGGNNALGVATSLYAQRPSNYMLVFMWLDAPGYGAWRPSGMRYLLTDGTLSDATNGTGTGEHCTMAYRAMVVPVFVEPGRTYHVEMQLTLDTGTAGASGDPTPTTDWNEDGRLDFFCKTDDEAIAQYSWVKGASNTVYRWKGPSDSLEYFAKYGVRWSGREEMHLGLGYRCAPWTAAGHIHAGIDSAPMENGGFQISDHSKAPLSNYDDWTAPDQPLEGGNTKIVLHQLRCAHAASETNVEINYAGMVDFGSGLATSWGTETGLWSGVYVGGRHPWGHHDESWQGLDPAVSGGVNTEALRGYRLVFQHDGEGVDAVDAAGFLLTINTMENVAAYGGSTYSYRMTPETGLGFVDNAAADFGPGVGYTYNNNFAVVVRCFRWHQRATEVSDFRIYSSPRSYANKQAEWSLWHETDLADTLEPGIADLVGLWLLNDGGGGVCRDSVAGNHAVFAPFALPQVEGGLEGEKQVYLSGEGERPQLDFSSNPVLKDLLRQALQDGGTGFAIQMRFRSTGAVYGQSRKIAGPQDGAAGLTDELWESHFAPDLLTWSVKDVDAVSPIAGTGDDYYAHGQHVQLQPLLTFGHRIHAEFRQGDQANTFGRSEPWYFPMPFMVKCAVDGDEEGQPLFAPGSGEVGTTAYGYPWYQIANVNVDRYHKQADWVGRTLTVQVGVEPSSTDETVNVYIAWTPSDALINTTQPPDAEFALYESETFHRRDLERSVITIGGVDPFERSWMGMGAKMFVDAVRVFGAAAPGDLPTNAGAAVATGTGKIIGGHAHPNRELLVEDILRPVGGGNHAVSVTGGSATVDAAGNSSFPTGRPELDLANILGTFLQIQDEHLVVPQEEQLQKVWPKGYLIEAVTASTLTLARPYEGDTKVGVSASTYRLIGYSAFGDAIQDKPLPVGKGKPLTYGATLVGDAVETAVYWKNPAPGGADWRVTLLSPVSVGRATDIHPAWCRGLMASRGNRILGLESIEDVIYAAAQGSLFEADDRWRLQGPSRTLNRAIHFRAKRDPATGYSLPLQDDRVEFDDGDDVTMPSSGRQLVWDAWVRLDEYFPVQTIAWCGRTDTDTAKDAHGSTGHALTWWLRLRNGHPELVLGSTGVAGSGPEKGLFIAKAEARVPVEEWAHVRVFLERDSANYLEPAFFINGKLVPTIVRVTEDTLTSPDWTIAANVITPTSDHKVVLGCARDSELQVATATSSEVVVPDRRQGWMHCLGGQLGCFAISTQLDDTLFSDSTNFDPLAIDYTVVRAGWATIMLVLTVGDEPGVGHMVEDTDEAKFGRLHAHPLISMWHEMGRSTNPVSFATYGREIFAANGGRVAIIEDRAVRPAGLLAPVNVPDFELLRDPIFEANKFDAAGDVTNDAIVQLDNDDPSITERAYHLAVPGSTYVRQLGDPTMDWGPNKYFAWSALLRMDSVDGRIPLYSRRNSLRAGGPFVECRDGFLYVGWWDTSLKKEVFVRTSKPVIEPGFDTYIYVRKFYPRKGIMTGIEVPWGGQGLAAVSNWTNSNFDRDIQSGGDGLCRDMCVVRKVPKADLTSPANYADWSGFDAKASIDYPAGGTWVAQSSSNRMCVSFVLAETDENTGTGTVDLTGIVLEGVAAFDGADTDSIDISALNGTFLLDHTGMLAQFERDSGTPSANFNGAVFRIVEVTSTTKIQVVNMDGTVPVFVAGDMAGQKVVIAPDISLVKSDDFDQSEHPDGATYPIEMFGSQLQANPLNGIMPFRGIVHCVKYGMFTGAVGDLDTNLMEEVDIFQDASAAIGVTLTSGAEIGTDLVGRTSVVTPTDVADLPFAGTDFKRLEVEDQFVRSSFNCRLLTVDGNPATPQPNKERKIARDSYGTSANDFFFATPEGTEPAQGLRRLRTRFIDPKNGAVSAPSEELQVFAVEEDIENPSENLRIVLTGLPVSADPQDTLLQVFMTVVDGGEFFLVGEVDSRSDSFSFRVDDLSLKQIGTVLDFREGAAPYAHVVGVAQSAMWYGDVTVDGVRQEDVVAYSVPFKPEVVPPGQEAPVDTGSRVGIVGIHEYAGEAVVFKRNSIFRASIISANGELVLSTRQVSPNDGAVSAQSIVPFEGRLYFVSDRGPMVLFSLEEEPVFIGRRISPYFSDTVEPTSLPLISAAINRLRDQFVFTAHDSALHVQEDRFAIEFDHPAEGDAAVNAVIAGHRFSKYQGPRVTALGSVVSKDGGPHDLIGGTAEGFVIWMDRSDVRTVMMGPTVGVWGATTLVAGAGNLFTGTVDDVFEGPRGAPLRWLDANGDEQFGYVIQSYLDDNADLRILLAGDGTAVAPAPVVSATVSLGALLARWSTSEVYFDAPHLEKEGYWLDVTRVLKASGQLMVDVYRDLASAPEAEQITLDLTEAFSAEDLGRIVKETRTMRMLMRTVTPAVDVDFELLDVTVRAAQTDNR